MIIFKGLNNLSLMKKMINGDNLKNIYLKKETGNGSFQITYSKSGYFKTFRRI